MSEKTRRPATPSFGEALAWWLKLDVLSFGGRPQGRTATARALGLAALLLA